MRLKWREGCVSEGVREGRQMMSAAAVAAAAKSAMRPDIRGRREMWPLAKMDVALACLTADY